MKEADEQAVNRRRPGLHRWVWLALPIFVTAAWLLSVSRAGTRVTGCPEGCSVVGQRQEGPLRVISLNVLHGFPRFARLEERLDLIAMEIRRHDADVVCLQEVPWIPRLGSAAGHLAEQTGLNHVYLRANGNRWAILFEEGEAILSRYPLRDVAWVELEPRAGFFEHRVALRATAVTPWGDVRVFVTHLTHGDPAVNLAQASSLVAFVTGTAEGPAVVAGDFNATEDTDQIQALASRWVDAYRAIHPDDEGLTCCIDSLAQGPQVRLEARIDYLFLVPGEELTASVVTSRRILDRPSRTTEGWLWTSDHVGLLSAIRFAGESVR